MARNYERGRPSEGWKAGQKVTSITDVKVGDVLVRLNHQEKSEDLFMVVTPDGVGTPDRVFCVQPCNPDKTLMDQENITSVWHYDLKRDNIAEWFFALREVKDEAAPDESPKPAARRNRGKK